MSLTKDLQQNFWAWDAQSRPGQREHMHLPPMLRMTPMPPMEVAGKEHGHTAIPCRQLLAFIGSTAIGLRLPASATPHAEEPSFLAYATDHPPDLPWEPCQGMPESVVARFSSALRSLGHEPAALAHGHAFTKAIFTCLHKHNILRPVASNESRTMVFSVQQRDVPRNVLYRLPLAEVEAVAVWLPGRDGLTLACSAGG